jgi:DNA-binding NarL/FixJ family response regulator
MQTINIGIVDDHKMFLDGLISVLSNEPNLEIAFAENNARDALLKIKAGQPDLVITDISMPEMNGIEFIKVLRKDFPEVKILVVSMFDNMQSLKDIDGFLLKETDKQKLIDAITGIVLRDETHFNGAATNQSAFEFNKSILSKREKEIIELIAQEFTTDEIALRLDISKNTIETHRKNIFFKLRVKNIAGLIHKAVHLGVIK